MTRSGLYTHSEQMQPQHFLNSVPRTVIVGIHLQGERACMRACVCVCVCVWVCVCVCGGELSGRVTAYVDFKLFELLTSEPKRKLEFSDVQVKGLRTFRENLNAVCVCVCVCVPV